MPPAPNRVWLSPVCVGVKRSSATSGRVMASLSPRVKSVGVKSNPAVPPHSVTAEFEMDGLAERYTS